MTMQLEFWGVRGSCAAPGVDFAEVGGNTSCIEVRAGDKTLIFDAGTGIRRLGKALLGRGKVDATLVFSHVHWDHLQGLPYFAPLFVSGSKLHAVGGSSALPVRECLRSQMRAPFFPVDFDALPSSWSFYDARERERVTLGDATLTPVRANHPDGVYAWRVDYGGRSLVYATDTEHYSCVDRRLVQLAQECDVLIYDAQYLPEEYSGEKGPSRLGWGHSTFEAAAALAREARVGELVLFHHDPERTDAQVHELEARCRALFERTVAAREGMQRSLAARSPGEVRAA